VKNRSFYPGEANEKGTRIALDTGSEVESTGQVNAECTNITSILLQHLMGHLLFDSIQFDSIEMK
jgi:hypothetical protein